MFSMGQRSNILRSSNCKGPVQVPIHIRYVPSRLGPTQVPFRSLSGPFQVPFRFLLGPFRSLLGLFQVLLVLFQVQLYVKLQSKSCQGPVQVQFRSSVDPIQVPFRSTSGPSPSPSKVTLRSHLGQILVQDGETVNFFNSQTVNNQLQSEKSDTVPCCSSY